jgi:hypothetical protein
MKKIFTFLFFAGFATSVMAQNTRNAQYRDESRNNQQSTYSNNTQNNNQNSGYTQNNGYNQNDQSYNRGNEVVYNNDRRGDERRDDRRFYAGNHYVQRDYRFERRREFERFSPLRFIPRVSIRYGQRACY